MAKDRATAGWIWRLSLSVLGFVVPLVALGAGCTSAPAQPATPSPETVLLSIRQGSAVAWVRVEIADTPEERHVGLSGRREPAPDRGMLFIFPQPGLAQFWMKDTYVPLSIAFISSDGTVLDVQDMEPLSESLHSPDHPYQFALEVSRGFFEQRGLGVGSQVRVARGQGQEDPLSVLQTLP